MQEQSFRVICGWHKALKCGFSTLFSLTFDAITPLPHIHTHIHTSAFQVQFLQDSVTVNESAAATSVNISLEILVAPFAILPSNVTVTVSATSEDFSLSEYELQFLAGTNKGTIQTLVISIFDDDLVEGTETFVVSGSVTSPAMFFPGRNVTTITIMDNERKCRPPCSVPVLVLSEHESISEKRKD